MFYHNLSFDPEKYSQAVWFCNHEYPKASKLHVIIDGIQVTESLQCSATFDFKDIEEGKGGRPNTHEEGDSHVLVDPVEYNIKASNVLELVSQQLHWNNTLILEMSVRLL